jgi:hypothetical protein
MQALWLWVTNRLPVSEKSRRQWAGVVSKAEVAAASLDLRYATKARGVNSEKISLDLGGACR